MDHTILALGPDAPSARSPAPRLLLSYEVPSFFSVLSLCRSFAILSGTADFTPLGFEILSIPY